LENFYHRQTLEIESTIARFRNYPPTGLEPMVEFFDLIDSDRFCNVMFGVVIGATEEKVTITKNVAAKLKKIRASAY
jgi:hypothetical protein